MYNECIYIFIKNIFWYLYKYSGVCVSVCVFFNEKDEILVDATT